MGRFLLRAGVLAISLGVFALLVLHAAAPGGSRGTTTARAPAVDAAATAGKADAAVHKRFRIRFPATKSDPHMAKAFAERAAAEVNGVVGILKMFDSDAGAPAILDRPPEDEVPPDPPEAGGAE